MTRVTCVKREGEKHDRNDADDVTRREFVEREEKAGDAGGESGDEKEEGAAVEALRGNQTEDDDKAGQNTDQAEGHVK